MNKKIAALFSTAIALSMAMPAFAAEGMLKTNSMRMASTSPTRVDQTQAIACVGAAVSTREAALGSALTTQSQSMQAAYSARASALAAAYKKTTTKEVKADVKAAWSAFTKAKREASSAWVKSKNTAWTNFRTAVKACKSSVANSVSDSGNSSSEAQGQ